MAATKKLSASSTKPIRLKIWLWPAIATVLGLAVRWSFIAKASIWHDEGFSVMLASRSIGEIVLGSARDVHPPGYYLLLHGWMQLFGSTPAALRSLSLAAGVAIIPLGFIIVRKIAGQRAAVLAAFLLALAPFLIRYSQEARMYGVLGLILLLALFCVVQIAARPKQMWPYVGYALAIAAGLYIHYFAALSVVAFWLYLIILESPRQWKLGKSTWLSWRWWLANLAALLLFAPWIPSLLSQLRRGQGLSWLPKATLKTLHDAIWQFFSFTDAHALPAVIYWLIPLVLLAGGLYLWLKDDSKLKYSKALILYSFVPMAIGLLVSLQKPIFHERYFAFAAIGIYMLVALLIDKLGRRRVWVFGLLTGVIILLECVGIYNVYAQSDHKMGQIMNVVDRGYQPGDNILAGELYVYFDGSYYNHTGQTMQLYTNNNPPNGYGESGLLYNRNVYLSSYSQVPAGSRVWLLGKTGEHDYYQVPDSWKLLGEQQAGYSEIRLYQVQ